MTLTPSTGLVDGQSVKVNLTGFQPDSGVVFRQCIPTPVNVTTDCTSTNTTFSAVTDSTGASELYLPVYSRASTLPPRSGYVSFPLTCDESHPCVIAAVTSLDLNGAVFAPVTFAPETDNCPDPGARAVFGSGSATAYRALYAWQSTTCVAPYNLPTVYAVSNGPDGVSTFGQGQSQANFGVAGPLPPYTLPSTGPSYKEAPITASAVVLAYDMYDLRGPQITSLTLTPHEISQIFLGTLNNFATDPGINSLNPGIDFPGFVQAYVRGDHSSETYVFTSWLAATLGSSSWPVGPRTVFPAQSGVQALSGSRALGAAVDDPQTARNGQGRMGFMDSSTAAYYGLPTVNIRMPSGAIVGATPTAIANGIALATQNSDGIYTPDYTPSDPTAWPMSVVTNMLVPTNQINAANGQVLAGFLKYAVNQGQSNLPVGYVPLPAAMVSQSMSAAGLIPQTATSSTAADSGTSGLGTSDSFGAGDQGGLGGLGSPGSLGGLAGPTSQQASPRPSQCAPSSSSSCPSNAAATTTSAPALLVAGSGALALVIAISALAGFGVLTGPVTYVLARRPQVLRRLERLRQWRPGRRNPA
jgi:hypothetical protein